jgi:16S rRNA (cytidine1402-2'-O)-methyltransferase
VRACRLRNIKVVAIPGPAAATAALSISGLPSDQFHFVGFLPSRSSARRERLEILKAAVATLVFYEAPHRIDDTLAEMLAIFGDREVCLCRELTKLYEESTFGKLSQIRPQVRAQGEFVIVVAGADREATETMRLEGLSRKEILKLLADKTGVPKKYLYDLLLKD